MYTPGFTFCINFLPGPYLVKYGILPMKSASYVIGNQGCNEACMYLFGTEFVKKIRSCVQSSKQYLHALTTGLLESPNNPSKQP